jgi:hypothetical protein
MATVSSSYATSSPVLVDKDNQWTFVAPEKTSVYMTSVKVQQPLASQVVESYGVFKPLGASKSVVVAGSVYGIDGTYEFTTQGDAEWDELYTVLTYQGTLHVHDPLGRQKYVRFVDRTWNESGPLSNLVRVAKVTYFEVEAP